jgi:hypothetical protein
LEGDGSHGKLAILRGAAAAAWAKGCRRGRPD